MIWSLTPRKFSPWMAFDVINTPAPSSVWSARALVKRYAKAVTLKGQGRAQSSNSCPNDEEVSNGISRQPSRHLFLPAGGQIVSILTITS